MLLKYTLKMFNMFISHFAHFTTIKKQKIKKCMSQITNKTPETFPK